MTDRNAADYLSQLNADVAPIASVVDEVLVSQGCNSYVKTIYVGYDIDGEMVAALYGHADHIELALALAEDADDTRLRDATHLTWRTLPLAVDLRNVSDAFASSDLLREACERVRSGGHEVRRDNDYFLRRRAARHSASGETQ